MKFRQEDNTFTGAQIKDGGENYLSRVSSSIQDEKFTVSSKASSRQICKFKNKKSDFRFLFTVASYGSYSH